MSEMTPDTAPKPAAKPAAKPPTKTSFVLSLGKDTPAPEVVTKAKAAGLVISEHYVHTIRSAAKTGSKKASKAKKKPAAKPTAKAAPAKKSATKPAPAKKKSAPAKKTSAKKVPAKKAAAPAPNPATKSVGPGGATGDKRAFIESMPASANASAIVAAAKKAGITISANYVYKLRNKGAPKGKPGRPKTSAPAAALKSKASSATSNGTPAGILSDLVVAHGIHRVRTMLSDVERRVAKLLAGG